MASSQHTNIESGTNHGVVIGHNEGPNTFNIHVREDANDAIIRGWLSMVDEKVVFHTYLSARFKDTGQWIIKENTFQTWQSGHQRAFFWLGGVPGMGKSTLITTIIESTVSKADNTNRVGYYFLDYRDNNRKEVRHMLASLTKQLSRSCPQIMEAAREKWNEGRAAHKEYQNFPPDEGWLFAVLKEGLNDGVQTTLIIDALDECDDQAKLVQRLVQLYQEVPSLSIFVTSRSRYTDFPSYIDGDLQIYTIFLSEGNNETEGDIRTVITYKVNSYQESLKKKQHIQRRSKVWKEGNHVIDTIVKKSNGVFLLATLHLEAILGCKNDKEILQAMDNLPGSIDETYARVLKTIEEDLRRLADHDFALSRFKQVLQWVGGSMRPLKLDELADALWIDPDREDLDRSEIITDPTVILGTYRSLVQWNEKTGEVSFCHYSLKEFLTTDRCTVKIPVSKERIKNSDTEEEVIDVSDFHLKLEGLQGVNYLLAERCLSYLGLAHFSHPAEDEEDEVYFMLEYSAEHAGNHCRQSKACDDKLMAIVDRIFFPSTILAPSIFESAGINPEDIFDFVDISPAVPEHDGDEQEDDPGCVDPHSVISGAMGEVPEDALVLAEPPEGSWRQWVIRLALSILQFIFSARNKLRAIIDTKVYPEPDAELQDDYELEISATSEIQASEASVSELSEDFELESSGGSDFDILKVLKVLLMGILLNRPSNFFHDNKLPITGISGLIGVIQLLKGFSDMHPNCNSWIEHYKKAKPLSRYDHPWKMTPLYFASLFGWLEGVNYLIQRYTGQKIPLDDLNHALRAAATNGSVCVIEALFNAGADVNAEYDDLGSALPSAAFYGHLEAVLALNRLGAEVDNDSPMYRPGGTVGNALNAAVISGNRALVAKIVELGANVNCSTGFQGHSLCKAIESDKYDLCLSMLSEPINGQKIRPDTLGGHYQSPLHICAAQTALKAVELMEVMLKHRGDIDTDANNYPYGTALQIACYVSNEAMVTHLLDNNAKIDAPTGMYGNAIQTAAMGNTPSILPLLLQRGADPNSPGIDLASYSSFEPKQGRWGRYISLHGSKGFSEGNWHGTYPEGGYYFGRYWDKQIPILGFYGPLLANTVRLCTSTHNRHLVLLENEPTHRLFHLGNPLQAAAAANNYHCVKVLLESPKIDVNAVNGVFGTALQAAAYTGFIDIAKLLLSREEGFGRADVNTPGGFFTFALSAAAATRNSEMAQLLVREGANKYAEDDHGWSFKTWALYMHDRTLVSMIDNEEANSTGFGLVPDAWDHETAVPHLTVSDSGYGVQYSGDPEILEGLVDRPNNCLERCEVELSSTILANHPIPTSCNWSLTIEIVNIGEGEKERPISIGVSDGLLPRFYEVGSRPRSWGYQSTTGKCFSNGEVVGELPPFSTGDIVGCGFNSERDVLTFSLGERRLEIKVNEQHRWWPTLSLRRRNAEVKADFSIFNSESS